MAKSEHIRLRKNELKEYTLAIEILREGKWFIAQCPGLDLVTQGRTRAKASKAMQDAVGLLFQELREMGTLEDVLLENNWKKVQVKGPAGPQFVPPRSQHKDLKIKPVALIPA